MPEHEREDGARTKEIVAWMNAGAALGAAALLGVGGYLLLVDDGVSPSGSTPSIESPEDAAPRSAADIDTRPPGVSPPAAERPTVRAAEDSPNLARSDRRRSGGGRVASRGGGSDREGGGGFPQSRASGSPPHSSESDGLRPGARPRGRHVRGRHAFRDPSLAGRAGFARDRLPERGRGRRADCTGPWQGRRQARRGTATECCRRRQRRQPHGPGRAGPRRRQHQPVIIPRVASTP